MERIYHPAHQLPTPGILLIVKLDDGSEVEANRPGYIVDRKQNDLGYRTLDDKPLFNVKEWSIR